MKVEEKNNQDKKTNLDEKKANDDKDVEAENLKIVKKNKELEEKILRSLAEMENQRRRFEKERDEAFEFGGFAFAKESLALIDNLERAKSSFQNDEKFKQNKDFPKIIEAFDVIEKDLIKIFERNGIEQINCLNKKFDPNFHQAMLEIDDDSKEAGTIIQEIQKGYTMKERLLRPSLVGITKFILEDTKKDKENKENNGSKK
tara:strand:+ start:2112 stop:2717 length:606 start_codon:yes stop_codon:yes gene_type:complete